MLRGFLCLLLECVQHIDGIFQTGQINHPKRSCFVPDTDFFNSPANSRHGLEMIRLPSFLHLLQLLSGLSSRRLRKRSDILQSIADE